MPLPSCRNRPGRTKPLEAVPRREYGCGPYRCLSSYCTKVIGENRIFKDTIRVYRDALSLLIRIVESEWDTGLGELYAKSTLKARRTVELLVHASRTSVAKYPEFDKQFYKYPSYLRRSTISEALGAVSSYRAAVSHWESAGRKGKEPRLQTSRSAMPTFYKDNMYEDIRVEIVGFYNGVLDIEQFFA